MLSRIKSLFTKLKMQISNSLKEEKEKRKINFTSTTSIHKKTYRNQEKKVQFVFVLVSPIQKSIYFRKSLIKEIIRKKVENFQSEKKKTEEEMINLKFENLLIEIEVEKNVYFNFEKSPLK